MHETRMLALGGRPRALPVGAYETDVYLRRTTVHALLAATLVSAMFAIIPGHPDPPVPDSTPSPRPIPIDWMPPPSIQIDQSGPIQVKVKVKHEGRLVVKSDSELFERDTDPFEEPYTGVGSGDDVVGGSGPVTEFGDLGDFVPPQTDVPEIFLFVEVAPVLVSLEIPEYPELAREAGVEGTVLVQVLVGEDGLVLEAAVLQGLPLLDEAALAAAYTAVFKPAQQSGRPVRTRVVLPVEFALRR